MRLIPFLFAFIFTLPLSAKEVIVTGTVPDGAAKNIRAYTYTDLLTCNEMLLTQAPLDKNSQFTLRLNLDETTLLTLKIDFLTAQLYTVPGKTYALLFDTLKPTLYKESSNPFLSPVYLNYRILNASPDELNGLIFRFDSLLNAFVNENATAILNKKGKKLISIFQLRSDSLFSTCKNEYFQVYRKYKTASFEESLYITSPSKLFEKYYRNLPVYISNTAYMEFFNQYFKMYFTDLSHPVKFSSLEYVINESCNYSAFSDTLLKDSNLLNEPLREMVIIKGLRDIYGLPGLKKENIISLLTTLAEKTKYPQNAQTARMVIKYLSGYPKGTKAADFTLSDKKLQTYKLSQFKGRYVYLFFWNTSCAVCMSEMALLNDIKRKYQDRLEIMGISVDMEPLNLYYFTDKSKFDFPLLHFAFNYTITDNFIVKTLPFFVLLDTDGNIVNAPALKPSENIYKQLDSLLLNKKTIKIIR